MAPTSSTNTNRTALEKAHRVYKFTVSEKSLDTVKATLPLVGKAGTDFTKHFYKRMFTAHPELQNVFNQTNQFLGGQPKKLLKTVALAAQAAIETGELPGEAIEGIAQKHASLNVTKEQYEVVGEHLLGTISDLLTSDQGVLDAWAELYGNIASVFIEREAEITEEVASSPGSWYGRRTFVLDNKEQLSATIIRYRFRPKDGKPTPDFEAGKYTTIWAPVQGEGPYGTFTEQPRHYTLALPRKTEDANTSMSITVKKQGLVSSLLEVANIGTEWELSAPYGVFVMSGVEQLWLTPQNTPIVFISAGVGVTPVLAMLENIYVTRPASWLHVAQDGHIHVYRDRLREIAAVREGELQRRVWYSNPRDEDGPPGIETETDPAKFNMARYHYRGRMNILDAPFDQEILHLANEVTQYFMCGPVGFMDAMSDALIKLGVDKKRIHSEVF